MNVLKMIYARFGKRLFDVVVAGLALAGCFPVLVVLGLLVKITSAGPVFFRQERMGQYGRNFRLMKLRTMCMAHASEQRQFTPGDVSRVTRIGKFLRRTKADELPELIHVLRGEMSLVGPRPEVPRFRPLYEQEFSRSLAVKPGITDLSSLRYLDEEEILARSPDPEKTYREEILPEKLKIQANYCARIRFLDDLKILFWTGKRLLLRGLGKKTRAPFCHHAASP